jgi:galactose-6-phosphate isomerase
MPLLDVSDVLDDPLFADDTLICTRNRQTMGQDGRAIDSGVPIPFSGVVTPASGQQLSRKPEGESMRGSISIITRFVLFSGKSGYSADIVTWNGVQYTVSDILDYSRFGAGFVQATADLLPLSG